jgi:hypothetical protein
VSPSIKVLCLTEDVRRYDVFARGHGVSFTSVSNVPELIDALSRVPHNGIVLELKKLIRATSHEKKVLAEFIETFPTLRVTVSPESDALKPLGSFDCFFGKTCPQFRPRAVRRNVRIALHLPVLVARINDPSFAAAERSHTINLSEEGCFLYSSSDWSKDRWALVRFIDLKEHRPTLVHIRWRRPWGAGLKLSGIGAQFAVMDVAQHQLLCRRFLLKQSVAPLSRSDVPAEAVELALRLGVIAPSTPMQATPKARQLGLLPEQQH